MAQQHDSWDSQGPGGEQVFDGRAATSAAAAMEQRPLPTPPPVTSPTSATSASKRPNPLEDLIYTETLYVEDLGVIIKVRAAWKSGRGLRDSELTSCTFTARGWCLVALQLPSAGARLDVSRGGSGVPHQQAASSSEIPWHSFGAMR